MRCQATISSLLGRLPASILRRGAARKSLRVKPPSSSPEGRAPGGRGRSHSCARCFSRRGAPRTAPGCGKGVSGGLRRGVLLGAGGDQRSPIAVGDLDIHAELAQVVGGDVAERADAGDLMGVDQDDLLALVAGFREQRLGAPQILLLIALRAGLGLVRAAADEERIALAPPALVAKGGAEILLLADRHGERLPRLRVVEGRIEVVRPAIADRAAKRGAVENDLFLLFQ